MKYANMAVVKAVILSLVLGSAFAMASREVSNKDFSGWLKEYDSLVFSEERNAFLFFNEDKKGKYSKIYFESVELFTETGKADGEHGKAATEYLNEGIRKLLEEKGIAAAERGPGVAEFRLAITGVEKSKEELKAHNLIPVSALFRGAQAATGNLSTYMSTMFEAEALDSVSGERIGAIVMKGIEETEKKSGDEITFDDFKPTLDKWLTNYSQTMDDVIARKADN